ncbi:hypothetical protein PAXRUDRAFT_825364 [Paxillus rubicundulus Ve08.2h10]|uniref:Uncharacterized protein n=1 Tax=Paxillus rubicundulus Ve08.2h10 TaxID=930991 RepID=A0A0D0DTB9_9AGAM|nr:hypothetical protein PAXRUDRAFT_825364 [Paxillus rubicundulus Ve08.2h10]
MSVHPSTCGTYSPRGSDTDHATPRTSAGTCFDPGHRHRGRYIFNSSRFHWQPNGDREIQRRNTNVSIDAL